MANTVSTFPANTNQSIKVEHPVVRHADGRRTRRGELSFFTIELNRLGHWKSHNYFDVPDETFSDGLVTGYRCGVELMAEMKVNGNKNIHMSALIESVMNAHKEPNSKRNRQGAAFAFMSVIQGCFEFTAKHANTVPWLEAKTAEAEASRDYYKGLQDKERADFAGRMKAAREAKRAKKAAQQAIAAAETACAGHE